MKIIFSLFFSLCGWMYSEAQPLKQLFNNQNLDGWIVYGTEKWYVENDELVCASGPDKGYFDFRNLRIGYHQTFADHVYTKKRQATST